MIHANVILGQCLSERTFILSHPHCEEGWPLPSLSLCLSSVATGSLFTAWWTMGGNRATDLPLLLKRGLWKSKPKMFLFLKQSMSLFSYSSHIFIIWIVARVRVRIGVRTKLKVGVRTKNYRNNYLCIWGGMLCKYVLVSTGVILVQTYDHVSEHVLLFVA